MTQKVLDNQVAGVHYVTHAGLDNRLLLFTISKRRLVKKIIFILASILVLAALACKKEGRTSPEIPTTPRKVVLIPLNENSYEADVTGYEKGRDAIQLCSGRQPCANLYYPWNGEDTIRYFYRDGFLYVDSQRVGMDLDCIVEIYNRYQSLDTTDLGEIVTIHVMDGIPPQLLKRLTSLKAASISKGCTNLHIRIEGVSDTAVYSPQPGNIEDIPHDVTLYVEASSTDADLKSLLRIENIRELKLSGELKKTNMRYLSKMKNLRSLSLFSVDNLTNRRLRYLVPLTHLRELSISFARIGDGGMRFLSKLTDLNKLTLVDVKISDKGLREIGKLHNLRVLDISSYYPIDLKQFREYWRRIGVTGKPYWTAIFSSSYNRREFLDDLDAVFMRKPTAKGWKRLSALSNLYDLNLSFYTLSEKGLAALTGLEGLEGLGLYECDVENAGLAHLAALPHLKFVDFNRVNVDDSGLYYLSLLDSLESLSLMNPSISNRGLCHLPGFKTLEGLNLSWAGNIYEGRPPAISMDDSAFYYISRISNLKYLSFYLFDSPPAPFDNQGLRHLKRMPYLTSLSLSWGMVNDTGLNHISQIPSLDYLCIASEELTNKGLENLTAMKKIKRLVLDGIEVDRFGIYYLSRLRGLEYLSFHGRFTFQDTLSLHKALPGCDLEAYLCED